MGNRVIKTVRVAAVFCSLVFAPPAFAEQHPNAGPVSPLVKRPAEYDAIQQRLASGWNTYENDSVLSAGHSSGELFQGLSDRRV